MTFRQAVAVVWRQRLLILAVMLIALAAAAVFLVRQTPVYTSPMTVRMSSLAAGASASGQIGTDAVDFNPEAITSPNVLDAAAKALGQPTSEVGAWDVQYTLATGGTVGQGSSQVPSVVVTITATGTSAEEAQKRVIAVEKAYSAYLSGQAAQARKAAVAQVAKWTAEAQADQLQVDKNPANSIAQSNLAAAISALGAANATITQIDTSGNPLLVTKAATPGEFQGTSPLIAVAVALIAGLIAGIGIALIWDAFDDRVRPDEDVEALTGVAALGELSLDKAVRRGHGPLPAAGRARTTLNEGLRSLRTTLQVLLPPGTDVIVVTSVEPGDGKTFISSNLALAWARMGRQVILVGGDLRRAGLEEYFGAGATGPGLTELLHASTASGPGVSRADVADALTTTPYERLRILPSGEEPWDPADLLALDAVGDIFTSLRELAEVVIVDSPPSLALVDARLLAAHADGVVVVASQRRTRRRPLAATVQGLLSSGVTVLGVVMNRSRRRIPASYSAYYGGDRRRAGSDVPETPDAIAEPRSAAEEPDRSVDEPDHRPPRPKDGRGRGSTPRTFPEDEKV